MKTSTTSCTKFTCTKIVQLFGDFGGVVQPWGSTTFGGPRSGPKISSPPQAKILNFDGIFLSKIFMGEIYKEINEKAKNTFKRVDIYKPLSSKKESKEIYIFCKGILKI